jgi:hypothetical protein
MKHIHDLQLHEEQLVFNTREELEPMGGIMIKECHAMRVPGGWIYRTTTYIEKLMAPKQLICENTVFVPYSKEFIAKKQVLSYVAPK